MSSVRDALACWGSPTGTSGRWDMTRVVALGEVLVEVMSEEVGHGFRSPQRLLGPFPSGAPAIFIDQVARLGQPCGIISCVGDDDFGRLNVQRLADDGADTTSIEINPEYVTGSAFVRYGPGGDRDFVFNIRNSAAGHIRLTGAALELLGGSSHLHVSGSTFFSSEIIELTKVAVGLVKGNGGSISFDPNLRNDALSNPEVRGALEWALQNCDIFLPSGEELALLTNSVGPEAAISEVLGLGVTCIVVKHGAAGATYYDAAGSVRSSGYNVEEVDPTGAGDCFDATFVTCRILGRTAADSLDYANASGARAVCVRGPMEGTSTFAQLDKLRSRGHKGHRSRLGAMIASAGPEAAIPPGAITSVCSAHPLVIEAALRQGAADGSAVLIEATCNQVNHLGGYTGLTPEAFRDDLYRTADRVGLPRGRILLGGDHLGPNPWRQLPAEAALRQAEIMVAAYVAAGYQKIHLDTSMGCQGEPEHLPDELTAARAARLAAVAEQAAAGTGREPSYVVGTEVPVPGGASHEIVDLEVTPPEAVLATLEAHRAAFTEAGAAAAFGRVVAVVVQPGVEFDDQKVVVYDPSRARHLSATLTEMPGLVFEAHSTDYQPPEKLARLVEDGFAILKVGPALTFAMREGFYALDEIAGELDPEWSKNSLVAEMEKEMVANPRYWQPYYHGGPDRQRVLRHFSYSDRIRYYWASPSAQLAVQRLMVQLSRAAIPEPLISQFLPTLYPRVASGAVDRVPKNLLIELVSDVLRSYAAACARS
jgi:D-tagatose-bisphosphate aldolase class II non-catalytic subunit